MWSWKLQNIKSLYSSGFKLHTTHFPWSASRHIPPLGLNYAKDMRPFLSENIRRKTTGNWKIFLPHNMTSFEITWAGKGRSDVSRKLYAGVTTNYKPAIRSAVPSSQKLLMGNYTSPFPGTAAELSFLSDRLFSWKNSTFAGRIFVNFILACFTKICQEIHVWLKEGEINIHNPCRPGRCTTCNWILKVTIHFLVTSPTMVPKMTNVHWLLRSRERARQCFALRNFIISKFSTRNFATFGLWSGHVTFCRCHHSRTS
jgi:hypothetical protein